MRRTVVLALLAALLLATADSLADDKPSPSEKKFRKTLTAGLADESEDVRRGPESGLIAMGKKAARFLLRKRSGSTRSRTGSRSTRPERT